ncbi:F-box/WD repeat-containing protein [Endozoicomonas sp. 8E]|uniref:F-box/WD repeat-containing protein n=1 Tax=Endozoicomonas sp. 8E TaxID=3035692 RepID=UPI002938F95F|nr:F-box protein [Endozoicomonas sp. 8E]WOG30283.1 F-box protein [Endozoicomonas sp. 8E]
MHGINNAVIKPPITQAQALSLTPMEKSAGRTISVPDKEQKSSFQDLTSDTLSLIFCHLKLRDIRSLQKVCTRLRDVITEDNALAKAWYRQLSPAYLNQLRMTLTRKDKNQLRAWFESFSNDQTFLKSITERQPTGLYSSALLFFTRAELMSQCKTFQLVTVATIDKTYKADSNDLSAHISDMAFHNRVNSAALSGDGRYLVTANGDYTAKVYEKKADGTWEIKTTISYFDERVESVVFSPDSHHVLISSSMNTAEIYDLGDESWEPKTTTLDDLYVESAAFSPDSQQVVTAGSRQAAKIHSKKRDGSWQLTTPLPHESTVKSAAFSSDGCYLITACCDGTVKIYSRKDDVTWEKKDVIPINNDVLSVTATFSPDCRYVATAGVYDCKAKIFSKKADGSWEVNTTIEHKKIVNSANFSPDGRHLVTASDDGTVKIVGRKADGSWEEKATFSHKDSVTSATFSPDSRHVVTASDDKTAKIIGQQDDGTWLEKATIVHDDCVSSATFSTDGSLLITSSEDGIVKITELRMNHSLSAVTE